MNRLLSTIPIAAAVTFAPFAMAQVGETAPGAAVRNSNAALDYWKIWETIDADRWSAAVDVSPSEAAKSDSAAFDALLRLQPDIRALIRIANNPSCDWQIDYSEGFDTVLPHLGKLRSSAKLLRADAARLTELGDVEAASVRTAAMLDMASQLTQDNVLICSLVGAAIANTGFEQIDEIVATGSATQADRNLMLASLNVIDADNPFGVTDAITLERDIALTWIEREFTGPDAREISGLIDFVAAEKPDEDHPLYKFTEEDILADLKMLGEGYDALLLAWNSENAIEQLGEVEQALEAAKFGELARVALPTLSRLRERTTAFGEALNAAKARLGNAQNPKPDSDG